MYKISFIRLIYIVNCYLFPIFCVLYSFFSYVNLISLLFRFFYEDHRGGEFFYRIFSFSPRRPLLVVERLTTLYVQNPWLSKLYRLNSSFSSFTTFDSKFRRNFNPSSTSTSVISIRYYAKIPRGWRFVRVRVVVLVSFSYISNSDDPNQLLSNLFQVVGLKDSLCSR